MNFKRIFIPEPDVETTKVGRLGEVFYWLGTVISLVLVISFYWEPTTVIAAPIVFLIGRALVYILSGR